MKSELGLNEGIQFWVILGFTLIMTGCTKPSGPLSDNVQEEIENAIRFNLDGIIVCVNTPEKTDLFAAGWHNKENEIAADPNCLFKIASISKMYIAAATTKMVSEGQLALNKTLDDYLPEKAKRIEHSDKITLKMLVKHRSGIPDFVEHPDYPWADLYETPEETYELVYDMPADFKPDAKYSYSNTNYLLLGDILDEALGFSHHQYISKEILKPLGLENTYNTMSEVEDLNDLMSGYFIGWEPDVKLNDHVQPGGSMVASAQDVSIFLRALIDGTLFSDSEQKIYSSIYNYEHTGLLPGYSSIVRYNAELDALVVLYINTSSEGNWLNKGGKTWPQVEKVCKRIMRILEKEND